MKLSERLGYGPDDRVLVLNADDVGSTHASNEAAIECLGGGSLTSGSILVPAPWFREIAAHAVAHPEQDFGLHLTLTCEYTPYRWAPLTDRSLAPGLYDADGGMWRTLREVVEHVSVEEAERELRAQIDTALAAGIDVTHIDTHMGTVVDAKYVEMYFSLGMEYGIPVFAFRPNPDRLHAQGLDGYWRALEPQIARLDAAGFPVLDHILIDTMGKPREYFIGLFEGLRPGLTHLLVHPAKLSPETQALGDSAALRNSDYELFRDRSLREELTRLGIHTITYREIRDAYRAGKLRA